MPDYGVGLAKRREGGGRREDKQRGRANWGLAGQGPGGKRLECVVTRVVYWLLY